MDTGELALKWEFPGGKIEPGETGEAAIILEIMEELSATIVVDRYLMSAPPFRRFSCLLDALGIKHSVCERFAKLLVSHLPVCHHGLAGLCQFLFRPIFTHAVVSLMFSMCMYALMGMDSKSIIGICVERCVPFNKYLYQCLTKSRIVWSNGKRLLCTPSGFIFHNMFRGWDNE